MPLTMSQKKQIKPNLQSLYNDLKHLTDKPDSFSGEGIEDSAAAWLWAVEQIAEGVGLKLEKD